MFQIRDFTPRLYQQTILNTAIRANTLICLPTGRGKTKTALLVAVHRLNNFPQSKVIFLTPTKPLAAQIAQEFKNNSTITPVHSFTGEMKAEEREKLFKQAQVVVSTPQGMSNDIINKKIDLRQVSLIIFDECVVGGTFIALSEGKKVKIEDLEEEIKKKKVYVDSLNLESGNLEPALITHFHKIPSHKKVVSIYTKGTTLKTTEDHLYFIKRNNQSFWIEAQKLQVGDQVGLVEAVKKIKKSLLLDEKSILTQYSQKQQRSYLDYYQVLSLRQKGLGSRKISHKLSIKEGTIRNWISYPYSKPSSVKIINDLKSHTLLPLYSNNPFLPIAARLFGHILGDGFFYRDKNKNLIIGFSGEISDLEAIRKDLSLLNVSYSRISSRITNSEINTYNGMVTVTGTSNQFVVSEPKLTKLFFALGLPVGDRTVVSYTIPSWIMNGSKRIKREFLSAFMGAEASTPTLKKNKKTFQPIRFSFYKSEQCKQEGEFYAQQLQELFSSFAIPLSFKIKKGNRRKDGTTTLQFALTLSTSNENLIAFFENINYTYSQKKRAIANSFLSFLNNKQADVDLRIKQYNHALKLAQKGFGSIKIGKILGLAEGTVENWIYHHKKPQMITPYFSTFSSSHEDNLLMKWTTIRKIKLMEAKDFVYDITVEKNHNYFANNILVHNCQHATGDYDYVWIAKQYQKVSLFPRILGLSASPGSDLEKISEVCQNLFIEDIEVRSDEDPDLKPYVQETTVEYQLIELPQEFKEARDALQNCFKNKLKLLKELGATDSILYASKTQLLGLQKDLQRRLAQGERDPEMWQSLSLLAEAMKIQFVQEMFETQGVKAAYDYFQKIYKEAETTKTKATKNLVVDPDFKTAYFKISRLYEDKVEHPKFTRLLSLIESEKKKAKKILIFNNFRDSASYLKEALNKIPGVQCELFVGQAKKKGVGMSQKQQIQLLDDFKEEKFNVLIGTSVGEEGIDIPAVDLIIFYEPVPSAIRTVQRRGRTGRMEEGKVIVLVTKGTRDEAYRWTAYHKESRMHRVLKDLKHTFSLQRKPEQQSLQEFRKEVKIYADSRERGSGIIKFLVDEGIDVHMQNLDVGDFLVSEKVGIERKEVRDFVDSLLDKRLLNQVKALKETFENPLLIIEGTDDLYSVRKVHPNAIRGMLAWIAIDMKVPILYTKDSRDTGELLITLARREQEEKNGDFSIRGEKKPLSTRELQEFIVAGLPGVGAQLAQSLLKEFRSVTRIMNASEKELQDVENIGKKKASEIRKILDEEYKEN